MQLRTYQIEAVQKLRESVMQGHRAPVLCAPTGSGKTVIFCELVRLAVAKGSRVLVIGHLKELIDQISRKLRDIGLPHGIIKAGYPADRRQAVQVGSVQSVANRLHHYQRFDMVICDEAHRSIAPTYAKIIQAVGPKVLVGTTGTPERLDGKGLGALYDDIVIATTTAELIAEGWLCPFRYFAPVTPDLSGVHTVAGEYQQDEAAEVMDKPTITGSAVAHLKKHCPDVPSLVFCVSIKHADHVAESFRAEGFRAKMICGKSHPDERAAAISDLESGRLQVLVNCQLYVEALDCPNVGAIVDLAPTRSLTRYLQRIGRGMRPHPSKSELFILDAASSCDHFGLPDSPREWSLQGRAKRSGPKPQAPVKNCPKCYRTVGAAATQCPECGWVFEIKPRELRQREGELVEIGAGTVRERKPHERARQAARTMDDLVALGRARGYKNPSAWAAHVFGGRTRSKAHA